MLKRSVTDPKNFYIRIDRMNVTFLGFLALCMGIPLLNAQTLTGAEYFFNQDPGPGQGTFVQVPSQTEATDLVFTVPPGVIAALPDGLNAMGVRVKDDQNRWSWATTRYFHKTAAPISSETPFPIISAEFFVNEDPGPGNGIPVDTFTGSDVVSLIVEIPTGVIEALPGGLHFLAVRTQNSRGEWSVAVTRVFHKEDAIADRVYLASRIDYQWYQDGSPVTDVKSFTAEAPSNPVSLDQLASLDGLRDGEIYQLVLTPYDDAGRQGFSVTREIELGFVPFDPPVVLTQPLNQSVTVPTGATFAVEALGEEISFQWQRSINSGSSWSNITGAISSSYNTGPTTTPMNGYRYRVVVSNDAGSVTSQSAILTVVSEPTEVTRGAFGTMRQVDANRYISDNFGELNFGWGGQDFTRAFSSSLQADLQEQNGLIFSELFGVLSPNPWGLPQWIISDYFGLIHFGEDGDQYAGWISSERFGWMRFVDAGGGSRFLWVQRLQTWMSVNPGGSFHSFDFGWLVPEAGSLTRYNSRIGILIDDEHNPEGWLRSDRFGFVWFARYGTGVWFWSANRNEWIGITPEGGLWSTAEGRFIF
jgi:hypothetical protein